MKNKKVFFLLMLAFLYFSCNDDDKKEEIESSSVTFVYQVDKYENPFLLVADITYINETGKEVLLKKQELPWTSPDIKIERPFQAKLSVVYSLKDGEVIPEKGTFILGNVNQIIIEGDGVISNSTLSTITNREQYLRWLERAEFYVLFHDFEK